MRSRVGQPDTAADIELRGLLDSENLPGFTMVAGAGSGKTTSLIKALAHVVSSRGQDLRRRTQKVACITYTEGAAQEIHADVGSDPLAHVSTVHSFLWTIVSPFQRNIAAWARQQAEDKLATLIQKQAEFSPRIKEATRAKTIADIKKLKDQLLKVEQVRIFRYGVGTDFGRGILGHEDVLKVGTQLIMQRPLLPKLLARQYPFLFVDESQDTFPDVVTCLKHVKQQIGAAFCLGFIGGPMQKVYPRGVGDISCEDGWVAIKKPQNFRSPRRVLEVMNHIRSEGDGLTQVSGRSSEDLKDGKVIYFVLPADDSRSKSLFMARRWLDETTSAGTWTTDDPQAGAKILVIAHRMAARRLGFENMYAAFHDSGSSSLSQALDEGTAWPAKFFTDKVLPLARASGGARIALLQKHCPRFQEARLQEVGVIDVLKDLRRHVDELTAATQSGGPGSVKTVLDIVVAARLVELDPRFEAFRRGSQAETGVVISDSTAATLEAFMHCDVHEIEGYQRYIGEESPYSTHQGVKGAEFPRVVVVLGGR